MKPREKEEALRRSKGRKCRGAIRGSRQRSTEKQDEMSVHEEVQPGRGSASLVQGEVDGYDELNVTRGKSKGGKENTKAKEESEAKDFSGAWR